MDGIENLPSRLPRINDEHMRPISGSIYPPYPVAFFAPSRRGYHMGIYIRRMDRVLIAYFKLKEVKLKSDEAPHNNVGYPALYATIKSIVDNNGYVSASLRAQELYTEVAGMGGLELIDVVAGSASLLGGMRGRGIKDDPRCVGLSAWKIRQLLIHYPEDSARKHGIRSVSPDYFMDFARGTVPYN